MVTTSPLQGVHKMSTNWY